MTIDIYFWLLALVGVLLTGISKSGFASGAGVVAVPLMALSISLPQALAVMLPLLIVMDIRIFQYYRDNIDLQEFIRIFPAALIGIFIGGLFIGVVNEAMLAFLLGVLSILFSLWHFFTSKITTISKGSRLWGVLSGLTSTLVHAGGPPISIYFLTRQLPKSVWLATSGAFFAGMNLVKIIPYSIAGQWSVETLWVSLVLIPIALIGVWLGKAIQQYISENTFTHICRGLLCITGIVLCVKAVVVS